MAFYGLAILGGGPAGTGPLMWAAQIGALQSFLGRGVAVIERQSEPTCSLRNYVINADSRGTSFLECLDPPPSRRQFAQVLEHDVTRELRRLENDYPPLALVSEFQTVLATALRDLIRAHPGADYWAGKTAQSLHLSADGSATVHLTTGEKLSARAVVMAMGGCQEFPKAATSELGRALHPGDVPPDKIISSDRLLTAAGIAAARQRLNQAGRGRAVVLGGSHSAFSAAWVLLNRLPEGLVEPGGITILCRRAPRIYYDSVEAARADNYPVALHDICPMTGRVHRLGGLRNDGRELWRRLTLRPGAPAEPRARLRILAECAPRELETIVAEAAVIVPALGYRLKTIPVFAPSGARLRLAADEGRSAVGRDSRLLLADGNPLANVFGIGLGSGYRPWGEMAGEPSFDGQQNSLWLYQHGLGQQIYENVERCWQGVHLGAGRIRVAGAA